MEDRYRLGYHTAVDDVAILISDRIRNREEINQEFIDSLQRIKDAV